MRRLMDTLMIFIQRYDNQTRKSYLFLFLKYVSYHQRVLEVCDTNKNYTAFQRRVRFSKEDRQRNVVLLENEVFLLEFEVFLLELGRQEFDDVFRFELGLRLQIYSRPDHWR